LHKYDSTEIKLPDPLLNPSMQVNEREIVPWGFGGALMIS